MGSIISNITDKINEHGSLEAYQKYLRERILEGPVNEPLRGFFKSLPVFMDSEGNEIVDGDRIKIVHHYNYNFLNGVLAVVRWSSIKGKYEYKPEFRSLDFTDFDDVHTFVIIR